MGWHRGLLVPRKAGRSRQRVLTDPEGSGQARPHLPPELWLHVFDLATDVPGALGLETHSHDPFQLSQSISGREPQSLLLASMSTKRALVRVCRQWRVLATPVLYRVVIANHKWGLRALRRTLVGGDNERATLLRACVRRFYCIFDGHRAPTDYLYPYEYLAEIIRALPNLVNFTVRTQEEEFLPWYAGDTTVPACVLDALAERGASLRVLEWDRDVSLCARFDELRGMLSHMRELRVLKIWKSCPRYTGSRDPTPLVLPKLEVISLDDFSEHSPLRFAVDQFESLRELCFRAPPLPLGRPLVSLASVAPQITRLTLGSAPDGTFPVHDAVRIFPNLRQLVAWYHDWHLFPPGLQLANIEYLGLGRELARIRPVLHVYDRLLDNLASMQARRLAVVRFEAHRFRADEWENLRVRRPEVFSGFRALARSRRFRLENWRGEIML